MEKKIFKFITVDNYEKEEAFLHQMSLKGWHFKEYKGLRYHFVKGKPENYIYRIDFKETLDDLDEYLELFKQTGWEKAFGYPIFSGEWIYFKKSMEKGTEAPQIYSDTASMVRLLKKLRYKWSMFGGSILVVLLFMAFMLFEFSVASIGSIFILVAAALIGVLYAKMFINFSRKINQLTTD